MSDEKITTGGNIVEEDADFGRQDRSVGCVRVSDLCCCIPSRRIHLPRRGPKNRKKRNENKKNANDTFFSDSLSEERKQNMSMTSAGDFGSLQTEGIKPALTVCIQISERTTGDSLTPVAPVALGDIYLECKEENTEKTSGNTSCTQSEIHQQMEGTENVSLLPSETKKKWLVGGESEAALFEERKSYEVIQAKANRQPGRSELLSTFLQGTTYKKEKQDPEEHVPFQELQKSRDVVFSSTMAADKNIINKEHNTSVNSERENSLQDQFNEKNVLCNDTLGLQELILDLTCKANGQVTQNQINFVCEENAQNVEKDYQGISNEEIQQSVETEFSGVFPTICEHHGWPREQQNVNIETEASSNKIEHDYLNLLEQEVQPPVIPKAANVSFQATTHEKTQEEVQTLTSSMPDIGLSKAEDHQDITYQVDQQVGEAKNKPLLSMDVSCMLDLQNLPYTNSLIEDVVVHMTDQKHAETKQLLLLEQTSRSCCSGTKEQGTQTPTVKIDMNVFPDNISHDKEQQRKLECGDSESEGIYDKKDHDHQGTVCLEMQQPSVFAKLKHLPLNTIPGEDQCVRMEDTNHGMAEKYHLDEDSKEPDDQYKMHPFTSSNENATTQQQEKQQPIMSTQEGCKKEEEQVESWLIQKGTSLPYEEQQQRQQMNLDMTCEVHQKEDQGLPDAPLLCNTTDGEEEAEEEEEHI